MKLVARPQPLFCFTALAALFCLVAAATNPLRAADDTDNPMAQATQPVGVSHLSYLTGKKPNAVELLAPPPLPDSPEQAADMEEVRAAYRAAGSNDIAIAYSQKKFSIATFAPVIGAYFVPANLPKTSAFFERVQKDAEAVTDNAKDYYQRPRPYVIDPSLANGKLEKSFSYPSGHSTESMVLALVLADLIPDRRDAIIGEARSIGWHRVQIARHYPTDIYAGRVFAQAIVKQMKKSGAFQTDFAQAKAEIDAARAAEKN